MAKKIAATAKAAAKKAAPKKASKKSAANVATTEAAQQNPNYASPMLPSYGSVFPEAPQK